MFHSLTFRLCLIKTCETERHENSVKFICLEIVEQSRKKDGEFVDINLNFSKNQKQSRRLFMKFSTTKSLIFFKLEILYFVQVHGTSPSYKRSNQIETFELFWKTGENNRMGENNSGIRAVECKQPQLQAIQNGGLGELKFESRAQSTVTYYNLDVLVPIFWILVSFILPTIFGWYRYSCFGHIEEKSKKTKKD